MHQHSYHLQAVNDLWECLDKKFKNIINFYTQLINVNLKVWQSHSGAKLSLRLNLVSEKYFIIVKLLTKVWKTPCKIRVYNKTNTKFNNF